MNHAESVPVTTEITGSNFPVGNISCINMGNSEATLLVLFSNYGIASVFETYDGGLTWIDKEGNLPDMPVRWGIIHPGNSNQVMLATETGVWVTQNMNDAQVTWTPAVNGMANVRVDQLNIRTSDLTVIAASHGRGIFTTVWDVVNGISKPALTEFSIYPNPVDHLLNITFDKAQTGGISVSILNAEGKTVTGNDHLSMNSNNSCTMDLSALAAGIYFVSVYRNGIPAGSHKIIKY